MDVDPNIKKSVVYIGYVDQGGNEKVAATGFVISRPSRITGRSHVYVVTARHVIDQICSLNSKVYLRLNLSAGTVFVEAGPWVFHPTDADLDVAICYVIWSQTWDHLAIPWSTFLSDPNDAEYVRYGNDRPHFNVGDEVLITGLFHQHRGTHRNIPIVRIGHIAALRDERVYTQVRSGSAREPYAYVDGYLIEVQSQSGLSGSPVVDGGLKRRIFGGKRWT